MNNTRKTTDLTLTYLAAITLIAVTVGVTLDTLFDHQRELIHLSTVAIGAIGSACTASTYLHPVLDNHLDRLHTNQNGADR